MIKMQKKLTAKNKLKNSIEFVQVYIEISNLNSITDKKALDLYLNVVKKKQSIQRVKELVKPIQTIEKTQIYYLF
jgi:hypothetical protein